MLLNTLDVDAKNTHKDFIKRETKFNPENIEKRHLRLKNV
jgi:hypothetical protein